jgi:Fur family transcriptional regulator, ferric uptake regulator
MNEIETACIAKGLRMTGQRRTIARVIAEAIDHPDVEELHRRAAALDSRISLATVYRTVRLFKDMGILESHAFHGSSSATRRSRGFRKSSRDNSATASSGTDLSSTDGR